MMVAASQFPVTPDVKRNAQFIKRHIQMAAAQGADALLFPEGALSGYGRSSISFDHYDWTGLRSATNDIVEVVKQCGIWVFLGSAHFLSVRERPTNSLYIISPTGEIVDRYDKSFLFGHELERYSAGDHPVVLEINGRQCGFVICYDSNFPELFNRYRHLGVKILFLAMNTSGAREITPPMKLLSELIPAQLRTRAIDNRMWMVVANSSTVHSVASAMIVRPDGSIRTLHRHRAGLLYHQFPDEDLGTLYNDKMMKLSENEIFHNGKVSTHARALDRRSLP